MRNYGVVIFGLFLILIGSLIFLTNINLIKMDWGIAWPLFILGAGLIIELSYFLSRNKESTLLIPAGILLTYGTIFAICAVHGYVWIKILWPMFILGPAFGIFQMYLFDIRDSSLLIPALILGIISLFFLFLNLSKTNIGGTVFSFTLIAVGFLVVYLAFSNRK